MTWTVHVICSLCSAKTQGHRHDEHEVAGAAAQREADASGFVALPAVHEEHRRRYEGSLCPGCVTELRTILSIGGQGG